MRANITSSKFKGFQQSKIQQLRTKSPVKHLWATPSAKSCLTTCVPRASCF